MGEVFAAHDLRLDREVALKLLRADLAEQDGMRERVVAEARLAARLTHPHVVGVLDTGEQDGRPFVVMERLSGRTLRDELADGPMPPERVRDVGLQVLRALAAAHELGIVHRDVKPGQHPRRRRRHVEGGGLRHREVGPRGGDAHRHRGAPREPVLPRPGTHRRAAGGPGERPLRGRRPAVRGADRPEAVRGRRSVRPRRRDPRGTVRAAHRDRPRRRSRRSPP